MIVKVTHPKSQTFYLEGKAIEHSVFVCDTVEKFNDVIGNLSSDFGVEGWTAPFGVWPQDDVAASPSGKLSFSPVALLALHVMGHERLYLFESLPLGGGDIPGPEYVKAYFMNDHGSTIDTLILSLSRPLIS